MAFISPHTGAEVDAAVNQRPIVIKGTSKMSGEDVDRLFNGPIVPLILDATSLSPVGGYIPCVYQKSGATRINIYGVTVKQGGTSSEVYIQLRFGNITNNGIVTITYKAYALQQPTQAVFEVSE